MGNVVRYKADRYFDTCERYDEVIKKVDKLKDSDHYKGVHDFDCLYFFLKYSCANFKWWSTWQEDMKLLAELLQEDFKVMVADEYTQTGYEQFYLITSNDIHYLGTRMDFTFGFGIG